MDGPHLKMEGDSYQSVLLEPFPLRSDFASASKRSIELAANGRHGVKLTHLWLGVRRRDGRGGDKSRERKDGEDEKPHCTVAQSGLVEVEKW